jgi:malate dehydrogenase
MRNKLTIVGAGNVGSSLARQIFEKQLADIVMVDVIDGLPQGKALDILQCGPIVGSDASITGTNFYEVTADSDVVAITSGIARKPGMSRDDLVLTNMNIVREVVERIVRFSPKAIIIMVTNPLDAMVQLALKVSGFQKHRVFGQSGVLDAARFRTFIAQDLKVSVSDIFACVLGGHGDSMVPVPRLTTVSGVPLTDLVPSETVKRLVERTVKGGGEIVALLKTGSAYYAPAAATAQMIEAVLLDKKQVLPTATLLEGEYNLRGVVMGVPAKIGRKGVESVIELRLQPDEMASLQKSAESVHESLRVMKLE